MKCSTYPFCRCGAELVQNLREAARSRVTDVWVQYGLFDEPELIAVEGRKPALVDVRAEDCAYPTSK